MKTVRESRGDGNAGSIDWSEWIKEKYEEFREGKTGNAASVTAFGRQFRAPHQVVLAWLRPGSTPPRKDEYKQRLIERYGNEAYEPLGLPAPATLTQNGEQLSPIQTRVLELLDQTPEEHQEEVLNLFEHYLLKHGFRRAR